jgi:hypothetical protein
MSEISVHDNDVAGLTVSCEDRAVVLHTIFRGKEPHERTDIIFSGVEAYYLTGDNMHSILFDVVVTPIDKLLQDFSAEFEDGIQHFWPGPWNKSVQSCRDHFKKHECGGWRIASSYGMDGFVIAKSMELRAV